MNQDIMFTIIGGCGAALLLFGFYRTSIGRWTNKSLWYELDNILGAALLITYSTHFKAYVSVVINAVWVIVAFRGLMPFAERYRRRVGKKLRKQVRLTAHRKN